MATLVDSDGGLWLGHRLEETPRLLFWSGGYYWLVGLDLFQHHVEIWKVDDQTEAATQQDSFFTIRGDTALHQTWEAIEADAHWNVGDGVEGGVRFMFISGSGGAPDSLRIAGYDVVKEALQFCDVCDLAGVSSAGSFIYDYDSFTFSGGEFAEAFKPWKCAVVADGPGVNVRGVHYIMGDDWELPNYTARAVTQRFRELNPPFYSAQDIDGLTKRGTLTNSYPRACARSPLDEFYADVFVTLDDATNGVSLWHQTATTGLAQGTPHRMTAYGFIGESYDVGLPWAARTGRQAIAYTLEQQDR